MRTIRPSLTATSALTHGLPAPSRTRPPRMTMSYSGAGVFATSSIDKAPKRILRFIIILPADSRGDWRLLLSFLGGGLRIGACGIDHLAHRGDHHLGAINLDIMGRVGHDLLTLARREGRL